MSTVVWREWYNVSAVKQLTAMGTLPRNEIDIDGVNAMTGEEIAREIVERTNQCNGEDFREGGEIVIIEPLHAAGTYEITTDYEPVFYVCKRGPDEEQ